MEASLKKSVQNCLQMLRFELQKVLSLLERVQRLRAAAEKFQRFLREHDRSFHNSIVLYNSNATQEAVRHLALAVTKAKQLETTKTEALQNIGTVIAKVFCINEEVRRKQNFEQQTSTRLLYKVVAKAVKYFVVFWFVLNMYYLQDK